MKELLMRIGLQQCYINNTVDKRIGKNNLLRIFVLSGVTGRLVGGFVLGELSRDIVWPGLGLLSYMRWVVIVLMGDHHVALDSSAT